MCPYYMNMKKVSKPNYSAEMNRPPGNWILLQRQTDSFSGDSRYMAPLHVYLNPKEQLNLSKLSLSECTSLDLGSERIDPDHLQIQDKITDALKLLTFRNPHVIVQFYSPHVIKKDQTLTAIDQPFGLGVLNKGLCMYRVVSERFFSVPDNDDDEEMDCSPVTRVFRRGLPEWTTDINNYTLKQFPLQSCAIRCGLHGYLALPVYNSTTGLCVGVIEVLTSSGYTDFAYEVQNIRDALETVNLKSQQEFDSPGLNAPNEHRQKALDKICGILKKTCDLHSLPLAQTWGVSLQASFVAHEHVIEKSCSNFDSRCVGKVCMSTTALPFYVKDMRMWSFFRASTEQHLDTSCGLVGKALLTRGSCFSGDARMNGLTSCFTIFLHSVEPDDDYVLEFYLPPDTGLEQVLNLVQTLKHNIPLGSGFELGDTSSLKEIGQLTDLVANTVSDIVSHTSSESDYMDDNFMSMIVTARITLNGVRKIVQFPMSLGITNLKIEVAYMFELEGEFRLTYMDEVNDEILITCDEDLKDAVDTAGSNDSVCLICQAGI